MKFTAATNTATVMFFSTAAAALSRRGATAFAPVIRQSASAQQRSIASATRVMNLAAAEGQAEVVLVGCGAPNRGMGWYHAVQMLEGK